MNDGRTGIYGIISRTMSAWARIWLRLRTSGEEHVPAKGACIIASNHASYLDPPLLSAGVRRRTIHFMARDTLFGPKVMEAFACVPIDRDRGDVGALRKGLALLKKGMILGLFPEGTRTLDGKLQEPKGGIGFLIAKAGVPVVPAFIEGSYKALPKHTIFARPAKVTVRYGPPIMPDEIAQIGTGREAYEEIARLVMERIGALATK